MSPPKYSDLLSKSNNVLLRGMHYGWWRFLCNTKANNGLDVITTGESNLNGAIIACFKWRKHIPAWNICLSQRFWSSKDISGQLSLINKPIDGLYSAIGATYLWENEKMRYHFKLNYANDFLNFNAFSALEDKAPPVNAAIVFGKDQFLLGLKTIFDLDEMKAKEKNICLGYFDGRFAIHGFYNLGSTDEANADMKQLALSVWNAFNDDIDMATLIRYRTDSDDTQLEFGVKYRLDDSAFLRVKVNNEYQLGVGLQQGLYSGMTLFLATRVNMDKFSEGGHKLGIALELNA